MNHISQWNRVVIFVGVLFAAITALLCAPQTKTQTQQLPYFSTLHVNGRFLYDTCGNQIAYKGPQLAAGIDLPGADGGTISFINVPAALASTGANYIQFLSNQCPVGSRPWCWDNSDNGLTEQYLQAATKAGLITEIIMGGQEHQDTLYQTFLADGGWCCETPDGGQCVDSSSGHNLYSPCEVPGKCDGSPPPGDPRGLCSHPKEEWYALPQTKALLSRYKKWLIINVLGEDALDEVFLNGGLGWFPQARNEVWWFRDAGYDEPLSVLPGTAGRDLSTLLDAGAALVAADPQHNVLLDWEAYWGVYPCVNYVSSCGPPAGYNCCGPSCGPYDGWYQQAYWPNTGIKEGLQMAADSGLPIMAAFDFNADLNGITFYDGGQGQLYPGYLKTANDLQTSWTWWILDDPATWGSLHNGLIGDRHPDLYCTATYGPFASVCNNSVSMPKPPDCINLPSYGVAVMQAWDAGTNRACGN